MSFKNITNSDCFIGIQRHVFDFTILGSVESLISTSSSALILKKRYFQQGNIQDIYRASRERDSIARRTKAPKSESIYCEPPTIMNAIYKELCLLSYSLHY
jgi:hypothetical protein